jgi:arabinogalactan oligomer/maltooligosaccharide transport system substrate-binding protein
MSRIHKGLAGTLAVVALVVAACGGAAAPTAAPATAAPTEAPSASTAAASCGLTVWGDELTHTFLKTASEKYTADTGVPVELVSRPFTTITTDYETQVANGTGPDLILGFNGLPEKWSASGIVAPLELGDKVAGINPAAVAASTVNGKFYMSPVYVENVAMIRNTDLVPQAPATMDELAKVGKELKDAGKAEYIISSGFDANASNWYNLYALGASAGAPWFSLNADGTYNYADPQFSSEGGLQYAKLLADWSKSGVFDPDTDFGIALSLFTEGKAPFLLTGPWDLPAVIESGTKFAVDPIPTAGQYPTAPMVGVYGLMLNPKSKCALAATDYAVNFMQTKDAQLANFKDSTQRPANVEAAAEVASDPIVAGFLAAGKDGTPLFGEPAFNDIVGTPLGQTMNAIMRGQGDPEKLWTEMATKIEADLKAAGF